MRLRFACVSQASAAGALFAWRRRGGLGGYGNNRSGYYGLLLMVWPVSVRATEGYLAELIANKK
jgi:hypothetical protein